MFLKMIHFILSTVTLMCAISVTNSLNACNYEVVESMPDGLKFNESIGFKPTPTHEALLDIIKNTRNNLRIASFYWTLSAEPELSMHPSTKPGQDIMDAIISATRRGVNLQVVLDNSSGRNMNSLDDVKKLKTIGDVKFLNMKKLLKSGILHSKFLISDNETFYLGSSNFDWRSYTQIKEIGIKFSKCNVLAEDLDKIFQTYTFLSGMDKIPEKLPDSFNTRINIDHPLNLRMNNEDAVIFIGGSPPALNGISEWTGRTDDIDGLLHIINKARHYVDISVMNYSPRAEFTWPKKFWPRIDNALRRAASERRVRVRLLFTDWVKPEELMWYKSLNAVQSEVLKGGGISVKAFVVPKFDEFQAKIPYARVKHDKYMVTDNGLYIGTSNWTPDYFINTCGASIVIQPQNETHEVAGTIIANMQDLFERDFSSDYSKELS